MIDDAIRVLAGDCTVIAEDADREEYRGRVTTIVKPDNTVLVHDIDGYQPVAWLTRADSVSSDRRDGFSLVAKKETKTLRIAAHERDGFAHYPASAAGTPVGKCPDCGAALVRSSGVHCVGCGDRYGVPADATVRDEHCDCDCGLPKMRVERGLAFNVCLDRGCESLDAAVKEAFDREWACPKADCDGDLRILRRGGSSPAASTTPTATPASPSPPASSTASAPADSRPSRPPAAFGVSMRPVTAPRDPARGRLHRRRLTTRPNATAAANRPTAHRRTVTRAPGNRSAAT